MLARSDRSTMYNTFNDFVNFFGIFIHFSSSSSGSIHAASKTTTHLQYPNTYFPKTNVSEKERKVLNIIDVPFTIHFKRSEHHGEVQGGIYKTTTSSNFLKIFLSFFKHPISYWGPKGYIYFSSCISVSSKDLYSVPNKGGQEKTQECQETNPPEDPGSQV